MMGPSSSKFRTVEMPPGVHEMSSLMEFLTNPKKFKRHLEELKKFTDDANKAVTDIATGKDIEKLLVSTKAKDEKADKAVSEAEQQASVIIERVTLSIEKDKQAAEQALESAQSDKSKYELLAKAKATELRERETILAKDELSYAQRLKDLEIQEAQVVKDFSLIEEKKKVLASL